MEEFRQQIRRRLSNSGRLEAVSANLLLDPEADGAFERLARLALWLLDAPGAFVTLVDDGRSFWKGRGGNVLGGSDENRRDVEQVLSRYVIARDDGLLIEDTRLDPRTQGNLSIDSVGIVAWAGFPIRKADGEVLGTLSVIDMLPRGWTAEDADILRSLGEAASDEVQLRAALAETDLARRRSEQLARFARRLTGASTTADVATAVIELGAKAVDADYINLGVIDVERASLDVVHPAGVPTAVLRDYTLVPLDTITPSTDAVRRREVVVVANLGTRKRDYPETIDAAVDAGLETVVHLPLVDGNDAVIGALAIGWSAETAIDTSMHVLLETIADLCALTLQRTRRSDAQVELIHALHAELLPTTPPLDGLDLAVRYLPADDALGLGGDWYDVLSLDADRTAIVVGDVVGHGVEAAARMTQVRSAINSLVRLEVPLGDLFHQAERLLMSGGMDYLATACIHIIDTASSTLTYVSAGHPPSIVCVGDEGVVVLPTSGRPPLGIGHPSIEPGAITFRPGDVLLAYTDGLIERRGEQLDEGIRRAGDAVFRSRHADVDDVADAVVDAALTPTLRRDDVAIAVVRCRSISRRES